MTIAIITRKRPEKLKRCLDSIGHQKVLPEQVLIIDNDPEESAKLISAQIQDQSILNIHYHAEAKTGYATARNRAFELCKTSLLGFIDDDCVLDTTWVSIAKMISAKFPETYILGDTKLLNIKSIIGNIESALYQNWIIDQVDKHSMRIETSYLDTKNVVLPMSALQKNKIFFDTQFDRLGGEDVDLGQTLFKKNVNGRYSPELIAYHEETASLIKYLQKIYRYGQAAYWLCAKWNPQGQLLQWNITVLKKHMKRPTVPTRLQILTQKNLFLFCLVWLVIKFRNAFFKAGFKHEKRHAGPRLTQVLETI